MDVCTKVEDILRTHWGAAALGASEADQTDDFRRPHQERCSDYVGECQPLKFVLRDAESENPKSD
jgi:hypothetical protein